MYFVYKKQFYLMKYVKYALIGTNFNIITALEIEI